MKIVISILLIFVLINIAFPQSWLRYDVSNGVTTTIPFTYSSTGNYGSTQSNEGFLFKNSSSDTTRTFLPIDLVNDPNAFPWRTSVKIGDCSGILIDPYHVLTAGHVVSFSQGFGNTRIVSAYSNGNSPYSYAYPQYVYLLSDYSVTTASDIAIIKLDRPIGALTGWFGIGFNNDSAFFKNGNFFNPSYPSISPFDGENMYNWKGNFSSTATEYLYSSRDGFVGMSGSGAYKNNSVYGILIASGIKFNRITANKFDAINKILSENLPASFDAVPINTEVFPKKIKNNTKLDSLCFLLLNYSSVNISNQNVTVDFYISVDSVISSQDQHLCSKQYSVSLESKSAVKIIETGIPAINKPSGTYYIGIIISGDNHSGNNITGYRDVSQIKITNTNQYTISGFVTSTQSTCGISGVRLNGFSEVVYTDYKGFYQSQVDSGWSGNITPEKTGFQFSQSSIPFINVTENKATNFSTEKIILKLSGTSKSPISHTGVYGVRFSNIPGEPVTNSQGTFTTNVYYGWSGFIIAYRNGLNVSPNVFQLSNISTNTEISNECGFYIFGGVYNKAGQAIQNALISGFPGGNLYTGSNGGYSIFLDSGWSGIIVPQFDTMKFIPAQRIYSNLLNSYYSQDFLEENIQPVTSVKLNLKVFLSGAYSEASDTMSSKLLRQNLIPLEPPKDYSFNGKKFEYQKGQNEILDSKFFQTNPFIVDWLCILITDSKFTKVDTVSALLRRDGRVLSISGDTLISLRQDISAGDYFVIIMHRNHIAVMNNKAIRLSGNSFLYDFTSSLNQYYGNDAKLLKTNLYGLYAGDANYNGSITIEDLEIFNSDNINSIQGYKITDFNLDGYITSKEFILLAPNKHNLITTKIPAL